MRIELMINKLQGCFALAFYRMPSINKLMVLLSFCVLTTQAAAVPVKDSVPEYEALNYETVNGGDSTSSYESFSLPSVEDNAVASENEPAAIATKSRTSSNVNVAHLLNTLEQVRSEVMELRGQFEQQAYLIEQLQKASRDRYLDLDARVARLTGTPAASTMSEKSASAKPFNAPLANNDKRNEEKAYQKALDLVHAKRFTQALIALKEQLASYPNGHYTDNVQYWLGEVYMAQGEYVDAKNAFLAVLNQHRDSSKVPDATYKLGRLHDRMGDKEQAQKYLKSVISLYPKSSAARLSDTYLESLNDY